jgi:formiminotetrahydrofolate cyclodeaminase
MLTVKGARAAVGPRPAHGRRARVIKIIQLGSAPGYNQGGRDRLIVTEFELWLDKMVTEPLPGGVAAAALAAALGAALVSKVAGIGQWPQALDPARREGLPTLATHAQAARGELAGLTAADEAAYQRVLDTRHLSDDDEARHQAWKDATETPLALAEACWRLLDELSTLEGVASTGVAVDLEIGRRLLEVGVEAGTLAAGGNLCAWGTHADSAPFQRRLAALLGAEEEQ